MQAPACVTAWICKLTNRNRRDIAAPPIHLAMQTATHHSIKARAGADVAPADFVPLHLETRPTVNTATAAHFLLRRPQTLRGWASSGALPDGLRPLRVNGRLAWPVAAIKAALGVTA